MNKRFLSVLVFALIVAGGASVLFYKVIASRLGSPAKAVPTTQLVVAARNLPVGTLIRDMDVKVENWVGKTPQNVNAKKEDVIGRGVVATIYEGEPVLDTRLAPKGAGAGLAATIPPGMRAVAVRVNEIIGLAGFVVPGMRVDVLISGNPPNAPRDLGTLSRTLLQNIEVLSAGQNIQKDAEGKPISVPVVNLLVTPEQAEVLSLAGTQTSIQLVLRNPLDTKIEKTPGTALAKLFAGQAPPPVKPVPRRTPVVTRPAVVAAPAVKEKPPIIVEVIQGSRRAETKFQEQPED